MRIESIRSHLVGFSIVGKRRTTIAHAFASALAPVDGYKLDRVVEALAVLGQATDDIRCVYCNQPAETWDHLVGLVSAGRFSGYGHVLGNLVPCCKACNSAKGNKDWQSYLRITIPDESAFNLQVSRITLYQRTYGAPGISYESISKAFPEQITQFERIQLEILDLMRQADILAEEIRSNLTAVNENDFLPS